MKIEILWIFNLHIIYTYAINCKQQPKCRITRSKGMQTADCYNREFREFPKCLSSDIEIIDLGYNRLRKITRVDLSKFGSLKHLYLGDNLISRIDKDLFDDASGLRTLDLSLNAILSIPPSIFHLPYLSSLYLTQNTNINIVGAVESARPVTSPLVQIDISRTTDPDNPTTFPNFGLLPFLTKLNITENFYFNITAGLFMGMCNLQTLISDKVVVEFFENCDCWKVNYWLKTHNVTFTNFTCPVAESECQVNLKQEDLELFSQCNATFEEFKRNTMLKSSLIIVGATLAAVALLSLFIFLYFRKNTRHKTKKGKTNINNEDNSPLHEVHQKSIDNIYS